MIIAGDLHTRCREEGFLYHISNVLLSSDDKCLVLAGDLSHRATEAQYDRLGRWLWGLFDLGVKIVMVPGNHDISTGLGPFRFSKPRGLSRWRELMGEVLENTAWHNDNDAIFEWNGEFFVCFNTTHPGFLGTARVRRRQIDWAVDILKDIHPDCVFHLVTHHSLWKEDGDVHCRLSKRSRLVCDLLKPFGFITAINGHNHRYESLTKIVDGHKIHHLQVPTLSRRGKGKFPTGFVLWEKGSLPREIVIP